MGFTLFLVSLGMLFAASMVGFLVIRVRADAWPPAGVPGLPVGLWIGTGILLVSSVTAHGALRSARAGNSAAVGPALAVTWALGALFLTIQIVNWLGLMAAEMTAGSSLYGFTFYMLTGLHGAHVIGGLIPVAVVTAKAFRGAYTADEHRGVTYAAMYWHFLDGIWLVMFLSMIAATWL
jgi:cytochrome c oxidase subunit III